MLWFVVSWADGRFLYTSVHVGKLFMAFFQVHAVDQDSGVNGKVTYEIEKDFQQAQRFDIDAETGIITTRGRFDRESSRYVSVTVIAKDGGMRPLIGICSFQVELLDQNDNPPVFERTQYETTVRQDRKRGPVIAVIATDADAGEYPSCIVRWFCDFRFFRLFTARDSKLLRYGWKLRTVQHSLRHVKPQASIWGFFPASSSSRPSSLQNLFYGAGRTIGTAFLSHCLPFKY